MDANLEQLLVVTGAGISAESGIPTFRGEEGYWTVGSKNYHSTEMATRAAFEAMPDEVWRWYLYRRGVCAAARPNAAHQALVELERRLEARFLLVTQNVDGLHQRAGNSEARTYAIHGNIFKARCFRGCSQEVADLPPDLPQSFTRTDPLTPEAAKLLGCQECGGWLRPHILWFDESYNEEWYRLESTQRAAETASAVVVVGTSGATTLPNLICEAAAARNIPLWVIDTEPTLFSRLAERLPKGRWLQGTAGEWVPRLGEELRAL